MSAGVWAEDTTLPLTSWREGDRVYVFATELSMTAAQVREAAGRLLDHADAIERGDPHVGTVQRPYLTLEQTQKLEVLR